MSDLKAAELKAEAILSLDAFQKSLRDHILNRTNDHCFINVESFQQSSPEWKKFIQAVCELNRYRDSRSLLLP